MSTRDALIREIMKQPEPLLRELQRHLEHLIQQRNLGANGGTESTVHAWPEHYFERTAGAFANEPLERPTQLPLEKRDQW